MNCMVLIAVRFTGPMLDTLDFLSILLAPSKEKASQRAQIKEMEERGELTL